MAVLETPVTMSLEREGAPTFELVTQACAAIEELVQPTYCSLQAREPEFDGFLHLRGEIADDADLDARHRVCDRVDSTVIADLLREAFGSFVPAEWSLWLSGHARDEPDDDEDPSPFDIGIEARADRVRLWIDVSRSQWSESGSPGRARVDGIGQALLAAGWRRLELDGWSQSEASAPPPTAARVLDNSLVLHVHRPVDTAFTPIERATATIEAIAALAPFFHPRRIEINTTFADEPDGETSAWLLDEAEPDAAGRMFADRCTIVPAIDRECMLAFVRDALAPRSPGGLFGWLKSRRPVTWSIIVATHAIVRVPEPASSHAETLRLLALGREYAAPFESRDGARWVGEPPEAESDADVSTPMTIYAWAEWLELEILVQWSLWAHAGTPGHADLERALDGLARLGWKRGEPPE